MAFRSQNGPNAGRLIVGGDHRETSDNSGKSWSHVIYSDDHGVTWHLGGGLVGLSDPNLNHINDRSNENSIVEVAGGVLYMSIRVNRAQDTLARRVVSASTAASPGPPCSTKPTCRSFRCEGSVVRLNDNVILFSSPASTSWDDETRHELTIWASYDNGLSWVKKKVVFFGYAGYSDMTVVGPDTVLLTFARGWTGGLGKPTAASTRPIFTPRSALVRVNLDWLDSPDPYEFDWYFNEKAAGETSDYRGLGVQDYGFWDQRAWACASSPTVAARYVAGPAGDTALQLTSQPGANGVVLSQAYDTALQAGTQRQLHRADRAQDDRFAGHDHRHAHRHPQLGAAGREWQGSVFVFDGVNTAVITSPAAINDGQWHHIAAVRDAAGRLLHLYVDHVEVRPRWSTRPRHRMANSNTCRSIRCIWARTTP